MSASFSERLLGALNAFFEGVVRYPAGIARRPVDPRDRDGRRLAREGCRAPNARGCEVRSLLRFVRDFAGSEQSGHPRDAVEAHGSLFFWLVFLSFLMAGLSALEVEVIKRLISEFFLTCHESWRHSPTPWWVSSWATSSRVPPCSRR